jgi:hypothetical protein
LCKSLNGLARDVSPGTYAQQVQKPTRDGLIALGCAPFIAGVLGAGAGVGLTIALGHTPMAHLSRALRVLIALVCPDLSSCPAERDVVKTFATPALAADLREMAGDSKA